jgi:hypothetical protein
MFDSLGDIWNANQQRLEQEGVRPGQMNTAGIAGQLIASGMLPKDAYVQAAKVFRDQENTNLQSQKQEVRMQQAHTASQILQKGGGLAEMLAAGISDPGILGALPQPQWIPNKGDPNGGRFVTPGMGSQAQNVGAGMGSAPSMGAPAMGTMQNGGLGMQVPQETGYDQFDTSELGIKEATKLKGKRAEKADEYVQKVRDEGQGAIDVVNTADELEKLIPQLFTGDYSAGKLKASRLAGINKESVEAQDTFNGRVNTLVEDLEALKKDGRATDAAAKLIIGAKPKETNDTEAIIRAIKARAEGQKERTEALQMWLDRGGDPKKFEHEWFRYENKNPFIKIGKNGRLSVNEDNLVKWRKILFGEEIGEVSREERNIDSAEVDQKERIRQILRDRGAL